MQGFGFRVSGLVSGSGFRVQDFGFRVSVSGQGFGFREGLGFGGQVSGFRVQGLGCLCRVEGLGSGIEGFRFKVQSLEFWVWGSGDWFQGTEYTLRL